MIAGYKFGIFVEGWKGIIPFFNYYLFTEKRAKEVGIRKVIGSQRGNLIFQFLVESIIITFIAFVFSLLLVELPLPAFNKLTVSSINIPYSSGIFWCIMMSYVVLTGLLSGSRPAFYLSSFKPVKVLKASIQTGKAALLPRNILVVLQFTCSIVLIISTIIIYQQIQHAKDRPSGFDSNRLVTTDASLDLKRNYNSLKLEMLQSGLVSSVTASSSPVTDNWNFNSIDVWQGKLPGENLGVAVVAVSDSDYFKTMGMKILEGRNFAALNDTLNVVLNEAAAKRLHIKNPVNQLIIWDENHVSMNAVFLCAFLSVVQTFTLNLEFFIAIFSFIHSGHLVLSSAS